MNILVPADFGLSMWYVTEAEPALWPSMVTCSGSPPNKWMFWFTHFSAANWSFSPILPGRVVSPVERKPIKNTKLINNEQRKWHMFKAQQVKSPMLFYRKNIKLIILVIQVTDIKNNNLFNTNIGITDK